MSEITLPEGIIEYQVDDWESEILGKKVVKVKKVDSETLEGKAKLLAALESQEQPGLVNIRIPEDDLVTRQALENLDYRLIEVYQLFTHNLENIGPSQNVRPYQESDLEAVTELGRASFVSDRFHSDPQIPREAADGSRAEWAANSCKGRAQMVLVPIVDEQVAGFSALKVKDGEGTIDLIATGPKFRGRGVGTSLVNASLQYFKDNQLRLGKVGTQGKNVSAIRVYENCGFRLASTEITYHKHF